MFSEVLIANLTDEYGLILGVMVTPLIILSEVTIWEGVDWYGSFSRSGLKVIVGCVSSSSPSSS